MNKNINKTFEEDVIFLENKVSRHRKMLNNSTKQLNDYLKHCPHTERINKSVYSEGGYDYRSSTIYYSVCKICGDTEETHKEYGGFQ